MEYAGAAIVLIEMAMKLVLMYVAIYGIATVARSAKRTAQAQERQAQAQEDIARYLDFTTDVVDELMYGNENETNNQKDMPAAVLEPVHSGPGTEDG